MQQLAPDAAAQVEREQAMPHQLANALQFARSGKHAETEIAAAQEIIDPSKCRAFACELIAEIQKFPANFRAQPRISSVYPHAHACKRLREY